jgi:hypothetical protein
VYASDPNSKSYEEDEANALFAIANEFKRFNDILEAHFKAPESSLEFWQDLSMSQGYK